MPLVYCCVAPHGGELVPELCPNKTVLQRFAKVRNGMYELSRAMAQVAPDTIIIASPHNLRLWKAISISFHAYSSGQLISDKGSRTSVELKATIDVELARKLYQRSKENGIPVVGANYGTFEGPTSDLPMDWGTFVPLWFLSGDKSGSRTRHSRKQISPRIVIVTPSREIPLIENVAFGKAIAKIANSSRKKRIAFVASADQAHAHSKNSPYGYSPAARKFDQQVLNALDKNELSELLKLNSGLIARACPDSIWQLAILAGIATVARLRSEVICYDVPSYFGMICASLPPAA